VIKLDHILWGAADLDTATKLIADVTGVTPVTGGSHPGFGTRNRLLSLGQGRFFEVIAPDPAQDLAGNRGGRLAAMPAPRLIAFALQASGLAPLRGAADRLGVPVRGPVTMTRRRPDGVQLAWTILYLGEPGDDAIPFVIDWGSSQHPSETTPTGCTLKSFTALHPDRDRLARIYDGLGIPVEVRLAPAPGFIAHLDTPRGELVLT
jgi:hypothetical protein